MQLPKEKEYNLTLSRDSARWGSSNQATLLAESRVQVRPCAHAVVEAERDGYARHALCSIGVGVQANREQ